MFDEQNCVAVEYFYVECFPYPKATSSNFISHEILKLLLLKLKKIFEVVGFLGKHTKNCFLFICN